MFARMPWSATIPQSAWEVRRRDEARADEAETVADALLESFAQPATVLDQAGRVRAANAAALREGHRLGEDLPAREMAPGSAREAVRTEILRGGAVCFAGRGREWRASPLRMSDERVMSVCVSDDAG